MGEGGKYWFVFKSVRRTCSCLALSQFSCPCSKPPNLLVVSPPQFTVDIFLSRSSDVQMLDGPSTYANVRGIVGLLDISYSILFVPGRISYPRRL